MGEQHARAAGHHHTAVPGEGPLHAERRAQGRHAPHPVIQGVRHITGVITFEDPCTDINFSSLVWF